MDINFKENEDGSITWSPTITKETVIPAGTRMTADAFNRLMIGAVKQSNHTAKSLAKLIETYNNNIPSAEKLENLVTNKVEVEETDPNAEPTVTILEGDNGPYFKFSNTKGEVGPQGPQGEQGKTGFGWYISGASSLMNNEVPISSIQNLAGRTPQPGDLVIVNTSIFEVTKVGSTNIKLVNTGKGIVGPQGPQGPIGPQGEKGIGIPEGGEAGQVLTKTPSGTTWETPQGGGGGGKSIGYVTSRSMPWETSELTPVYMLPKGFETYKFIHPEYGVAWLTKQQLESESGIVFFNNGGNIYTLRVLTTSSSPYVPYEVSSEVYGVTGYYSYVDSYDTDLGQLLLIATE